MNRFLVALVLGAVSVTAQAELEPRFGGQAVYDTDRDITWIADRNLAESNLFGLPAGMSLGPHPSDSSGLPGLIFSGGNMNWPGALHWIDAMNTANYLGVNDWRLPHTLVPDSGCTNDDGTPSSVPFGYDCAGSEMGHLFYDEFGAERLTPVVITGDPAELAKFSNDFVAFYWSGTDVAPGLLTNAAYSFLFGTGAQTAFGKNGGAAPWPVHDGDPFRPTGDADGDGTPDDSDNCIDMPNGATIPDAGGNIQRDTDNDGYGNVCDPDFNNDGLVTVTDFLTLRGVLNTADPDADLNGDSLVTVTDFLILRSFLNKPPGPSAFAP